MKNLLTMAALGAVLLTSCGDDKAAEELKRENQMLKERIAVLEHEENTKIEDLKELDTLALGELVNGVSRFKDRTNIMIPSAWDFEEDQLNAMLNYEVGSKRIVGIMAYPMNVGDTLKVGLVPYYMEGGVKKHFDGNAFIAFDYSDMVPSKIGEENHRAENAKTLFGSENKICVFNRLSCTTYDKDGKSVGTR